ncbi:hypothetical protein [Kitasatospora sp. CB01950]|uniref:hypothetical protein n=1 Tax=Kitasatospora sp. CB01950 TaxID=1703930 RepID=UPI00093D605D|nr:hypothetical protein [Kitasatospora sp. CB01950]OKJ06823.1 hypothetical protein AMK19_23530 [Kitasatospora sp. CB01950]
MAATTAGAFRAWLGPQVAPVPVVRDGASPGQPLPYIAVQEGTNYLNHPTANGDYGDPDRDLVIQEMVQVDVVQQARTQDAGGAPNAEDYTLVPRVIRLCSGPFQAGPAGSVVNGVQFISARREPIVDNVVRTSITVLVTRTLERP